MTQQLSSRELHLCTQVRAMCACDGLRRAARGVTQHYDAVVAESGLKVTQLPILVALGMAGDLTVTALAGALALDRTTLTRNLRVLEDRGLLCTYTREEDARMRVVSLTAEGSAVLGRALERWETVQDEVQERFGSERLRALLGELAALSAVLEG
jgi:DNA-binding MarR family transcriptional regulator